MIQPMKRVVCDEENCWNYLLIDAKSNVEARKRAREQGWSCSSSTDGYDHCPDHKVY